MTRVFVIDDNALNARLAALILERSGYAVTAFISALAAIEATGQEWPDVVVTDIGMPEMNGKELCRTLRQKQGQRALWMVAYTAFSLKQEVESIMQAGFDAIATKPVTADSLLSAVRG